ncbi:MAG TPA: hypothetical protein VME92_11710 [Acetobacteraceae bacterium]|nr:hypothetical protein [Acetobacteraceae bacterium]
MQLTAAALPPMRPDTARKLAVLLARLGLAPRQERLLAERIRSLLMTRTLDDAVYIALREKGYSDRHTRLILLATRRADPRASRRRSDIQRVFERITVPDSLPGGQCGRSWP